MPETPPKTSIVTERGDSVFVRLFAVTVVDGPDRGLRVVSDDRELSIGTDPGCHLRLTDPSVSGHHTVLRASELDLAVRDLGSTNGTVSGTCRLRSANIKSGTQLRLGRTTVAVEILDEERQEPLASEESFGELLGGSVAMRRIFPLLERGAESSANTLVTGETGTGKEVTAESIHSQSPRRKKPFVVVDCGALPRKLMESELFGHVRGAYTGADTDREGAFAAAHGGTLFLDEIGELPLELQPLLLRAVESRSFRPLGGRNIRRVDIRIIAATNRDLRKAVNKKLFRSDLYFRLNVLHVELPPLRDRSGDIPLLAAHFWSSFRPGSEIPSALVEILERNSWRGNVRELRNAVERAALIGFAESDDATTQQASFGEAKEAAMHEWERHYVEGLLRRAEGNLSKAAQAARMSRSHLRLLMTRYGIEREDL